MEVFISYASADRESVLPVMKRLRALNIGVWIDDRQIPGAADYAPEIVKGIKECKVLLLMATRASFVSKNVAQEVGLAWKHDKPILPLLLEKVEVPDEFAYWLEGKQQIPAYGNEQEWMSKLRQALFRLGVQMGSQSEAGTDVESRGRHPDLGFPEGERKLLTVLFCDMQHSPRPANRISDDDMHALLNRFFRAALAEVSACDGTINQSRSGGFMALFGAPIAHEDHAQRAASAALAIQRVCHASVADPLAGKVPLRIAINTGWVVLGRIGDNPQYSAIGDAVNLASSMQQTSSAGDILLTRSTWELVHRRFDCEELGSRQVEGESHSIPVYRLRGLVAKRSPDESASPSFLAGKMPIYSREAHASHLSDKSPDVSLPGSPLVGRSKELLALRERIAALRRGEGGVAVVIGDAGLGKSRLLAEVRRTDPSVAWLQGHAQSFGSPSYAPFAEALRGLVHIEEREGADANWRRLETFLVAHLREQSAPLLPFAGMLVGMELPAVAAGLIARLDPKDVRAQIFIVARRIFTALSRAKPTVLQLEDWHWTDDASVALLLHLLPLTESEAMLVVITARPDREGPTARVREAALMLSGLRYEEFALSPLSPNECAQMIGYLFKSVGLPAGLRDRILRRTEGNPLFIEEISQTLQQAPKPQTPGPPRYSGDEATIELPDTIEAIIAARIDRLEAGAKRVLRLAAVIGRSFYHRVLQGISEAKSDLEQRLDQLQQLDFIRRGKVAPELEYVFKHALVQEASYRSILDERRRELHQQVAAAIEALFAGRLNEVAALLAHHYAQAGNQSYAQRYLLRAGDQAARMASDVDALEHYTEALQSYAQTFGDQWDRKEHASLERKIGEALFRRGEHEQAAQHLYRALELLGYSYPRTRFGVRLHILLQLCIQIWRWISTRSADYTQPGAVFDRDDLRAICSLMWTDYFRDTERYFLDVLCALNWAERDRIGTTFVESRMGLSIAFDVVGLGWLAAHALRRALRVSRSLKDPYTEGLASFGVATHQIMQGEWAAAIASWESAMTTFEHLRRLREYGIAASTLTWILQWRGEFSRARVVLGKVTSVADEAGDKHIQMLSACHAGYLQMHAGRLPEALATLLRALEYLRSIPDLQIGSWASARVALCLIWMGDRGQASAAIEDGFRLIAQMLISPHVLVELEAVRCLQQIMVCEETGSRGALRKARWAVHRLRRLRRGFAGVATMADCAEGCIEWQAGRHGLAEAAWKRSIQSATELGAEYQLAVTYQEMGRSMRRVEHLETALAFFEKAELSFQTARTLRYLSEIVHTANSEAAGSYLERALAMHASMSADHERQLAERMLRNVRGGTEDGLRHAAAGQVGAPGIASP